ncbi:family 1 glycosylhydrolase [Streptomyces sp. NPDC048179]|uniref:family 1 glycosylhydrolase n=1 Tax=Streptomyces sp. NPDC048179 TaxID=3365506 RepID=UPI0037246C52
MRATWSFSTPMDFLGINYYIPTVVRDAPHRRPDPAVRSVTNCRIETLDIPGVRRTAMRWAVLPHSRRDLLVSLRHQYAAPILITENGSAEDNVMSADGQTHDPDRIEYLRDHMAAVANAAAEGVDVRGYYVWSLLDNYECAFGYDRRFGIVHAAKA